MKSHDKSSAMLQVTASFTFEFYLRRVCDLETFQMESCVRSYMYFNTVIHTRMHTCILYSPQKKFTHLILPLKHQQKIFCLWKFSDLQYSMLTIYLKIVLTYCTHLFGRASKYDRVHLGLAKSGLEANETK